MKNLPMTAFLSAAAALSLAGCVVMSVNPFCSKDRIVPAPELTGEWRLTSSFGSDMTEKHIQNWRIGDGKIVSFDEKNIRSEHEAKFFKVKDVLLADLVPGEPADNMYWKLTVLPMHVLVKVELDGDTLRLLPADYDWFVKGGNEAAKNLPRAVMGDGSEGKMSFYTCPPSEWEAFLDKNIGTPEMFSQKNAIVLKRVK